jgi:hypothetical protein
MNPQRGQSMTEFAVGAAVLALLMLGTITLAGYQEVQRRSVAMARQAAFETAWRGSRAARVAPAAHLYNTQLDDVALEEPAGGLRYVRSANDVRLDAAQIGPPGQAGTTVTALVGGLRTVDGFLGGDFDLTQHGYLQGSVAVIVAPQAPLPAPFTDLELQFRQPYALLTDEWNSGDAQHVRRRVSGLVPTQRISDLSGPWQSLLAPLSLIEPALAELCLGLIEPDRVPEDRLGPGSTPRTRRCP